jgi:2,3-bisphosphoglycerate-dependent phosphoglycerate mutase
MTAFLKLVFIRHAESTGNVERRMQGHGDYPLTSRGEAQAQQLAIRLRSENRQPTAIYSSPLQRAAETTAILAAAAAHPPIHYDDALVEFQNGIFQGLTWPEAQAQYPELCQQLESSPDWIPIPQAETLTMARDRAQQILSKILTHHQNGDQIWVVSHSWFLQHLIAVLLGSDRAWRIHIRNTAIFEFWIDASRWQNQDENRWNTDCWQIIQFNDDRHLSLPPA